MDEESLVFRSSSRTENPSCWALTARTCVREEGRPALPPWRPTPCLLPRQIAWPREQRSLLTALRHALRYGAPGPVSLYSSSVRSVTTVSGWSFVRRTQGLSRIPRSMSARGSRVPSHQALAGVGDVGRILPPTRVCWAFTLFEGPSPPCVEADSGAVKRRLGLEEGPALTFYEVVVWA